MPETPLLDERDIEILTKHILKTGISEFICTHEKATEIEARMSLQYQKTLDVDVPIYVKLDAERDAMWNTLTLAAMVVMRDFLTQSINEYNHMKVQS